jgi:hypothetical protein
LVGRYPPACCSSRLPVFLLRLLQKVNGAQCQQLSLAVLLAWLEPSYHCLIQKCRTRAGIGSACSLSASPTPDLRFSARAAPTCAQILPGCTPRLQWGSVAAWSSTAATTGFVRGHRPPVTTNNRRVHRDTHHRCTRTYVQTVQSSTCVQVQSSLLKASTTNLTAGPVATPAPCGVICLLQPAWIK